MLSTEDVHALQTEVELVSVAEPVVDYILALVQATRTDPSLRLGVSPRGAQILYRAARALALVERRAFVCRTTSRHWRPCSPTACCSPMPATRPTRRA